jgi:hypothetical protein
MFRVLRGMGIGPSYHRPFSQSFACIDNVVLQCLLVSINHNLLDSSLNHLDACISLKLLELNYIHCVSIP